MKLGSGQEHRKADAKDARPNGCTTQHVLKAQRCQGLIRHRKPPGGTNALEREPPPLEFPLTPPIAVVSVLVLLREKGSHK